MPLYDYKALNSNGKEVKGNINSENISQAKQKLRSMGLMLMEILEQKVQQKKKGSLSFGTGISTQDLALMTRQFATLIKAKIQIVEALSALVDQSDNHKLKIIMSEIKQKVNEGTSLSASMNEYPKVFDNVYVNMIDAGETSGNLDIILLRLAEFTESQVKLKNKIRAAMIYPMIMTGVGALMMGIIFIFVIPKITKIFISMKKALPLQTKICIWISEFLRDYWWLVIVMMFFTWWGFIKYTATKKGEALWHKLLLNFPIVGQLTMMINVSRFCSTLATLLNSGVPILMAMKIVRNLIGNVHMQVAVDEAKTSIAEGGSIALPLQKSGLFPSMVTHMIKLGEKSGELEPMLEIVAANYKDEVDARLNGLTSVLEPIMLVLMGGAVAFIVFSVVVPLMDLNTLR